MTNNTHSTILRTIIERIAAAIDPSVARAEVDDTLNYGRNRFFLSVTDARGEYALWTGAPVMVDEDEDGNTTLWVRPRHEAAPTNSAAAALEPVQDILDELRAYQTEHGKPNGWQAAPGHETYVLA